MGRLTRAVAALILVGAASFAGVAPVAAFTGFGPMSADARYDVGMTFRIQLEGGAPDQLELLLRFAGDDATYVAPVQSSGSAATYTWDTTDRFVTPNTRVTYQWRATVGGEEVLGAQATLLYDDDRPGLDWHSAQLGDATVHWYGGAEAQARRFGELSAEGAARAEALLGHDIAGPVDIFVYDSQDEFFGALGPGAREWTGAATYPQIRTIFMWLQGGPRDYLETTIVHEVTHVVFNDATDNPYHEPAKWLNEGLATWSEQQSAASEDGTVRFEASGGGLFAFEAISQQFPIGSRGATLSYAQGATMVDMIIRDHGRAAMSRIAAAYRDGASDAEALQAGTGESADDLYAAYYEHYGVPAPQPVEPAPIGPSVVTHPGQAPASGAPGATPSVGGNSGDGGPNREAVPGALVVAGALILVVGLGAGTWVAQRRVRRPDRP